MGKIYFRTTICYTINESMLVSGSPTSHYNNKLALKKTVKLNRLVVLTFLLLQKTAIQSSILFLSRTVDRISQTCLVVKKSTYKAAEILKVIPISDIFKLMLSVIATSDECQELAYLLVPPSVSDWDL